MRAQTSSLFIAAPITILNPHWGTNRCGTPRSQRPRRNRPCSFARQCRSWQSESSRNLENVIQKDFMNTTPAFTPDDLVAREHFANPYPVYRGLRDHSPVRYISIPASASAGIDKPIWAWGLLKYHDVYTALRDHET